MRAGTQALPVWLLGLCNFPLGAYFAVMLLTVPQLLAANGVAEQRIAGITAVGLIPSFCSFLVSPVLDWRFTRRAYAVTLAIVTAAALIGALKSLDAFPRLTMCLFVGTATANLYQAALGGWFGSVVEGEGKARLGAWFAVANVAGGGVTAAIAIVALRQLPFEVGIWLLGTLLLWPLLLFPWINTPVPDRTVASESFRDFFRDVASLLRRPNVVWTLLLFALPAASFALTNTLSGLGRDFKASEPEVASITGAGVTIAGVVGSLVVPRLVARMSPQRLYILIGTIGALFTLLLRELSPTTAVFALAVLGQNVFQSSAFAVEAALVLLTIGERNPLAATQYGFLIAAPNLPLTYMQAIDGWAYGVGGLSGALAADAAISLTGCALASQVFRRITVEGRVSPAAVRPPDGGSLAAGA